MIRIGNKLTKVCQSSSFQDAIPFSWQQCFTVYQGWVLWVGFSLCVLGLVVSTNTKTISKMTYDMLSGTLNHA